MHDEVHTLPMVIVTVNLVSGLYSFLYVHQSLLYLSQHPTNTCPYCWNSWQSNIAQRPHCTVHSKSHLMGDFLRLFAFERRGPSLYCFSFRITICWHLDFSDKSIKLNFRFWLSIFLYQKKKNWKCYFIVRDTLPRRLYNVQGWFIMTMSSHHLTVRNC